MNARTSSSIISVKATRNDSGVPRYNGIGARTNDPSLIFCTVVQPSPDRYLSPIPHYDLDIASTSV
jgi:hypothetical protein